MAWKRSTVRTRPGPPQALKHLQQFVGYAMYSLESMWSPKRHFCLGSLGIDADFHAAHGSAFRFNEIEQMGTLGTVFRILLRAGKKTICFLYRRCPSCP